MQITSGKYSVVTTGCINSDRDNPIAFEFPEGEPKLRLRFEINRTSSDPRFDWVVDDSGVAVVTAHGDDHDHFGHSTPQLIGTYKGRDLLMSLRINTYPEPFSYTLFYTFYTGDEANDE